MSNFIPITYGSSFSAVFTWKVKPPSGSPPGTPNTPLNLTNYTAEIRPSVTGSTAYPAGLTAQILDAALGKILVRLSAADSAQQLSIGTNSHFRLAVISALGEVLTTPAMTFRVT